MTTERVCWTYSPRLSRSYRDRTFWAAGTILRLSARLFQFDQALFMVCENERLTGIGDKDLRGPTILRACITQGLRVCQRSFHHGDSGSALYW